MNKSKLAIFTTLATVGTALLLAACGGDGAATSTPTAAPLTTTPAPTPTPTPTVTGIVVSEDPGDAVATVTPDPSTPEPATPGPINVESPEDESFPGFPPTPIAFVGRGAFRGEMTLESGVYAVDLLVIDNLSCIEDDCVADRFAAYVAPMGSDPWLTLVDLKVERWSGSVELRMGHGDGLYPPGERYLIVDAAGDWRIALTLLEGG